LDDLYFFRDEITEIEGEDHSQLSCREKTSK